MDITSNTLAVNGVELHVMRAGPADGRLVILLHGFPDFWWGWRHQIEPLAAAGFRVIVPDLRGYNLSDKPAGLDAYLIDTLAADVVALADVLGGQTFRLIGHDWGGVIAFWVAARYPARVARLAVINGPHPDAWGRAVRRHPGQAVRSYYVALFQLPWLPERLLRARRFWVLRSLLGRSALPGSFTDADLERYVAAWSQPGAMTAMLNYYRAMRRRPRNREPARIATPTLLIWGLRDVALTRAVAEESLALCDDGHALYLPNATHWAHADDAAAVNAALAKFLRP